MQRSSIIGQHERGATAVMVALLLTVIGGFCALVINTGHLMTARNQLQNAVDAAALAGSMELSGDLLDSVTARLAAQRYANEHKASRQAVAVDLNLANLPEGDIVVGVWDHFEPNRANAFQPATVFTDPLDINAVLVRAGRTQARGNPLQVFFSAFMGQDTANMSAEAVAVYGPTCEGCSVPLAFADCQVRRPDGGLNCGIVLRFSEDTQDNIGFSNLAPGRQAVNTSDIIDILDADCGEATVGDVVGVSNGNNMTPGVIDAFRSYIDRNGPRVTAAVISPESCPDARFVGLQPVVGFASFTVTGIYGPPELPKREIHIQLDCDEDGIDDIPSPGGCGRFGLPAEDPRLVR